MKNFSELKEITHTFSFKEQFEKRNYLDFYGTKIETIDIIPPKLKTERPILFVQGFGETLKTLKDSLETLYKKERRVLLLSEYPRYGADIKKEKDLYQEYPEEILRKALIFKKFIAEKNLEKIDVIATSEGTLNIIVSAMIFPEKFDNIVLDAPAGLIGKNNSWSLFQRFIKNLITESEKSQNLLK